MDGRKTRTTIYIDETLYMLAKHQINNISEFCEECMRSYIINLNGENPMRKEIDSIIQGKIQEFKDQQKVKENEEKEQISIIKQEKIRSDALRAAIIREADQYKFNRIISMYDLNGEYITEWAAVVDHIREDVPGVTPMEIIKEWELMK